MDQKHAEPYVCSKIPSASESASGAGYTALTQPSTPTYRPKVARQAASFTAVEGVSGPIATRRPIDALQSNYPDIFNIFVLALQSLQAQAETRDSSYYQLSGIHGFPFVPWQYPVQATDDTTLGYCTHGSGLFTSWHRPYMIVFEQLLQKEAVRIAASFRDAASKTKYGAAAASFRLPYWDWSSQEHIPAVLQQQRLSVIKPDANGVGRSTNIPNPLYNYRFQTPQGVVEGTTLGPVTRRSPNADTQISDDFASRQANVLTMLTINDYNTFSDYLENSIHGPVHVQVGQDMGIVSRAAFDPIFWLHHCEVDRLVSWWQALHPGVKMTPRTRSETFALHGPGPDDLSTPLYPFRHRNGAEWTSNEVSTLDSTRTYGFVYPDFPSSGGAGEVRSAAIQLANKAFAPNLSDVSFKGNDSGVPGVPSARREWAVNVISDSDQIPGSYKVLIYIKNNQTDTNDLAGSAAVFSGASEVPTTNSIRNVTVPLTQFLIDQNYTLNPRDVVPKLVNQLSWSVERVGLDEGQKVPVEQLSSLKVAVSSTIKEYSKDGTKLPIITDSQTHFEPTVGKKGGLQADEKPIVGVKAVPGITY
ncbi:MAG: hypothetical protein M1825_000753 [Sarcosagium campestre]|nr:MAG: hypothetical protein M1825_000753 [Sarcosagium campestre]